MARPESLDPLFRSLRSLKGVGPQLGALLDRFFAPAEGQEPALLDLLMHMPVGIVDRRRMDGVARTFVGHPATLRLHIDRHEPPPGGKANRPHRVYAHDETGDILLIYFRAQGGWVEKLLPVGEERFVSGTIGFFNGVKQITHPDYVVPVDNFASLPLVEPVYPLTQGLTSKALTRLMRAAVDIVPPLPEWIPDARLTQFRWPRFEEAMRAVHLPQQPADGELWGPARNRLAYDEYLAGQLAQMIVRSTLVAARAFPATSPARSLRGSRRPCPSRSRRARRRPSPRSATTSPRPRGCRASSRAKSAPARQSSR